MSQRNRPPAETRRAEALALQLAKAVAEKREQEAQRLAAEVLARRAANAPR